MICHRNKTLLFLISAGITYLSFLYVFGREAETSSSSLPRFEANGNSHITRNILSDGDNLTGIYIKSSYAVAHEKIKMWNLQHWTLSWFSFPVAGCLTKKGVPCHFPFRYKGTKYAKCVKWGNSDAWCSTRPDFSSDSYGTCSSDCPIEKGE